MGMLIHRHFVDQVSKNITLEADLNGSASATPEVEEVVEVNEKVNEAVEEKTYTRTQINRLSTADLQKLAKNEGLDATLSGAKLKELLITHFGL